MKEINFVGPQDAPSVLYLSDSNNFSEQEQAILLHLSAKAYELVIKEIVDTFSVNQTIPVNLRFVACIIDQLAKQDKEEPSRTIRKIRAADIPTDGQFDFLYNYTKVIKQYLLNERQPNIAEDLKDKAKVRTTKEEQVDTENWDQTKKDWSYEKNLATLYLESGYFATARATATKAVAIAPKWIKKVNAILKITAEYEIAARIGANLRYLSSIKAQNVQLKKEKDITEKINAPLSPTTPLPVVELADPLEELTFVGDAASPSVKYLSNFQQFSAEERGILFDLLHREYNIMCYSMSRMLTQQAPEDINWNFFVNIFIQLAKMNDKTPNSFFEKVLDGKWTAKEVQPDITYYFETIHRTLLDKKLPDISAEVDTKAINLTNNLQTKKGVKWSAHEWKATYHRASAYVYKIRKYYLEMITAGRTALSMSDTEKDVVNKWINGCLKFVHAQELGILMKKNRLSIGATLRNDKYIFQICETPSYPTKSKRTLLEQFGIDTPDNQRLLTELLQANSIQFGSNNITFTGISEDLVALILSKVSTKILKNIELRNINFTKGLPDRLFEFINLGSLAIYHSKLSEIPQKLATLINLHQLTLRQLPDIKLLPESIGKLTNLSNIQLSLEHLESLPSTIENWQKVRYFDLANSKVKTLPDSINQLTQLETLLLSHNQLTTLPDLSNLIKLKKLKLGKNPFKTLNTSILELPSLHEFQLEEKAIDALENAAIDKIAFRKQVKQTYKRRQERDEFYRKIGK